jgi:hypothetical protein
MLPNYVRFLLIQCSQAASLESERDSALSPTRSADISFHDEKADCPQPISLRAHLLTNNCRDLYPDNSPRSYERLPYLLRLRLQGFPPTFHDSFGQ